jgi:hypothetical protein
MIVGRKPRLNLKSILYACLMAAVLAAVFGCAEPGEQDNGDDSLVINGGFENGSTGWTLGTNAAVAASNQHSGSACLSVAPEANNASYAEQSFAVTPGTNTHYLLQVWVRRTGTTGSYGGFKVSVTCFDAGAVSLGTAGTGGEAMDAYAFLGSTVNLPAATVRMTIRLYNLTDPGVGPASDMSIAFDDVALSLQP